MLNPQAGAAMFARCQLLLISLFLLTSCEPPGYDYTHSNMNFVDYSSEGHFINLREGNKWVYEDAQGDVIVDWEQVPIRFNSRWVPVEIIRSEVLPFFYGYHVGNHTVNFMRGEATCYFATLLPTRSQLGRDGFFVGDTSIFDFSYSKSSDKDKALIAGSFHRSPSPYDGSPVTTLYTYFGQESVTTPAYTGPASVWRHFDNSKSIVLSYYFVVNIGLVKFTQYLQNDEFAIENDSLQLRSYHIAD